MSSTDLENEGDSSPCPNVAVQGTANPGGLGQLKRHLRPVLVIIALGFVAYTAHSLALSWSESPPVRVSPVYALLSVVPLLLGAFFQAKAWVQVIERLSGHEVPQARALALYFDSQLARYAGKLGLPVVRMAGAESIGTSSTMVGTSIGIEMLSWVAIGALVGVGASFAGGALEPLPAFHHWLTPLLLTGSLLVVAGLALWPLNRYPKLARKLLKNAALNLPLLSARAFLYQLLYWLAWALHGVLVVKAFGVDFGSALTASGLFPLATVAGFLVLVAPSGLGMREAVLALSLTPIVGASPALMATLLSRAASLAGDFVIWALLRWKIRTRAQG